MRHLMWSLLAGGLFLAGSGTSQAQDTVRLGGPTAQADIDGGADTVFARGGGRGGYGGGHYGGGYGRGYGYGGYGFGRGYGYGLGYGFGYGLGYGLGYGYYRPYYGYGYGYYPSPVYYYQPSIYYSAPSYYYPMSGSSAPAPTVQARASYSEQLPTPGGVPPMPPANDGTFPYDGGPRSPVPMPGPGEEFSPAKQLRSIVPIDGKLASVPAETTMGSLLLTSVVMRAQSNSAATPAPRTGYAAYGEDPVTAPVRKR